MATLDTTTLGDLDRTVTEGIRSTTGKFIEGECLLTSVSMTMAVGEVLSADVSFEMNGAPRAMVL